VSHALKFKLNVKLTPFNETQSSTEGSFAFTCGYFQPPEDILSVCFQCKTWSESANVCIRDGQSSGTSVDNSEGLMLLKLPFH